jgi:cytochrome oxidase Cu insertion factor (SCO1/SenC/PrrC family)
MRRAFLPSILMSALLLTSAAFAGGKDQSSPEPTIKVGDTAPDFTLTDQNGKKIKLSDFRGKSNVVLAFYVFAFTGG